MSKHSRNVDFSKNNKRLDASFMFPFDFSYDKVKLVHGRSDIQQECLLCRPGSELLNLWWGILVSVLLSLMWWGASFTFGDHHIYDVFWFIWTHRWNRLLWIKFVSAWQWETSEFELWDTCKCYCYLLSVIWYSYSYSYPLSVILELTWYLVFVIVICYLILVIANCLLGNCIGLTIHCFRWWILFVICIHM
jgi:hypothetical protein